MGLDASKLRTWFTAILMFVVAAVPAYLVYPYVLGHLQFCNTQEMITGNTAAAVVSQVLNEQETLEMCSNIFWGIYFLIVLLIIIAYGLYLRLFGKKFVDTLTVTPMTEDPGDKRGA